MQLPFNLAAGLNQYAMEVKESPIEGLVEAGKSASGVALIHDHGRDAVPLYTGRELEQ